MRVRVSAAAVLVTLLVACTQGRGGAGGRAGRPAAASTTTSTGGSAATSTVPPATTASTSTTVPAAGDPPGSVTLHAGGLTLPNMATGGGVLRVLVRPASTGLTVRRRGGGGGVTACPVTSVAGPATGSACVDLVADHPVTVSAWGVELRATGAEATVDEVSITYLPADTSVTLVTPSRTAGACSPRTCTATFSLTPPRAGTFRLDGRAGDGRPTLTLSSNSGPGSSIRTLATVQGGGNLSITATLDGQAEATLAYREDSSGPVPALTAEILWP